MDLPPTSNDSMPPKHRVSITASVLCSYSYMRGQVREDRDPVYYSLYPGAGRKFKHPVQLPTITDRTLMEKLPRSAKFFWDHLTAPTEIPPQPRPSSGQTAVNVYGGDQDQIHRPELEPQSSKSKHYKGDMVYANFGYVQIDQRWVDPESQGELYNAYMKRLGDQNLNIAEIFRPRHSGPRIMSKDEQDEFYKQYVQDVTDDADGEGDPRDLRITPAIFARWAEGASKIDGYVDAVMEPTKLASPFLDKDSKSKAARAPRQPQFDLSTGSIMSDIGEQSSEPNILRVPEGVNSKITKVPERFSQSYPLELRKMNREAFGKARQQRIDEWVATSVDTISPIFNSEEAVLALANENDPESGIKRFRATGHQVLDMYEANVEEEDKLEEKAKQLRALAEQKTDIQRQLQRLEMLFDVPESLQSSTSTQAGTESSTSTKVAPSPAHLSPRSRLRSRYEQHFAQRLEEEEIAFARNKMIGEKLDEEIHTGLREIEELKKTRDELLAIRAERGLRLVG